MKIEKFSFLRGEPYFFKINKYSFLGARTIYGATVFIDMYTICEEPSNVMPRGLQVSRPLIANMIPFVNISNFLKWITIYIVKFRVAHWDALDDSLAF